MKKARNFIALAAALAICTTSAVSCGGKEKTKTPQTADAVVTNSYRSESIEYPSEIKGVNGMMYMKDVDKIFITAYDDSYNTVFYTTDTEFSDFTPVDIELTPNDNADYNIYSSADDDGSMYFLVMETTHGDIPKPDWNDENFDYDNFDYEAYEAAAETTCSIVCVDADGNSISNNPIDCIDDRTYLNFMQNIDNESIAVGISGEDESYIIIGIDGKKIGDIDMGDFMANYAAKDTKGRIACDGYGDGGECIRYIDADKMKLTDEKISLDNGASGYNISAPVKGSGDYTLYLPMSTGLYGIKEDGSLEELVNWLDSDIDSNGVNSIVGLDNGDFILVSYDYNNGGAMSISRLTKRDTSEMKDTIVVTLGVLWSDMEVQSMVTKFNKSNDKYRVKVKDYSEFDVYDDAEGKYTSQGIDQLKNDIISGNAPDMIAVYNGSIISSLAGKGIFTDLYTFMENDSEIKKDIFLPNILTAFETDGKLYSIPPSFSVSTYAGKTKYLEGKENWTMDEFVDTCNNLPEGMKMFKGSDTRMDVFYNLISYISNFIDYQNKKCSFDSDEFIKFLEFCNTFPETSPTQLDYETASDEEISAYYSDMETQCLNDKALLDSVYISTLRDYATAKVGTFGEDITLVGLPSSDGQGGMLQSTLEFAILSDSGCKDAAWEFFKAFFSEEYQSNLKTMNMPVVEKYFDIQADECMEKPYYINDDGEKEFYDNTWYIGDHEVKIPPLTQEERDFVVDYVKGITKLGGTYSGDIFDICNEEVEAYFNGEKTAEETAKMIQNRASIIISEQG